MNVQSEEISSKKSAILRSVLELVGENGLHGVPMSRVAKNAGVAAGTIYHYFENKEAIIRELAVLVRKQMAEAMFSEEYAALDYRSQFFVGWTNFCRFLINNKHTLTFIEQFNSSPYSKPPCEPAENAFRERFDAFFQMGMDQGVIKKMEHKLIAAIVFGCILSAAKFQVSGKHQYTDEELSSIANIIWDGIRIPV